MVHTGFCDFAHINMCNLPSACMLRHSLIVLDHQVHPIAMVFVISMLQSMNLVPLWKLVLMCFCPILMASSPHVASSSMNASTAMQGSEANALLKWRASLDNQSQALLSLWTANNNNSTCNWVGIACDESNSVFNINLTSFGLRELAYTMAVNEKSDVYSFGILTWEILFGKHPGDVISSTVLSSSRRDVASTLENLSLTDKLDQRLPHLMNSIAKEVISIVGIAIACLTENPHSRPSRKQVAKELVMPKSASMD